MNIEKLQKYRVLYVEDEEIVQLSTLPFLEKFFAHIDLANNGKEGLEKFQANKYDLIITDMVMPKMSGSKMLEKIKEIEPTITTIIHSAATKNKDDKKDVCDIYIQKPIAFDQFIEILDKLDEIIEKNKTLN